MIKKSIYILILLTSLVACNKAKRLELSEAKPNVTNVIRFDSLLLHADSSNLLQSVKAMYKAAPEFMPYYVANVMGSNPTDTVEAARLLGLFLTNSSFKQVNKDVEKVFANADTIQANIDMAYQYLNQYFPEIKTPKVYFYVSGFNTPIILEDQFVGIGLDLYLGGNYPAYREMSYEYLLYNMRPASIAPDLLSAILFKHFTFDGTNERLLESMLYRGKIMYLLSLIMPQVPPHDIMGYTRFEWEWSRKYESKIWNSIVGQKDLYSTDLALINKYLNDAPFTATISQESPGRLGTWVGWQIIGEYMKNNPDVSIVQLMKLTDYQQILNKSEYQP